MSTANTATQSPGPSKKQYKSIRMFKSDFWEQFTFVHPVTPILIWGPVSLIFMWRSFFVQGLGMGPFLGMAALGLFVWSFSEYALHRFVFHYVGNSELEKRLHFIMHGVHHDDPNDPLRLVMPPVAALILAVLLFSLFRVIFGPVYVEPFFAFFLVGYLAYDYTHYYIHHFTPKTRVGRFIKQNHMLHHFAISGARWGVTSPLWDHVFGTVNERKQVSGKAVQTNDSNHDQASA